MKSPPLLLRHLAPLLPLSQTELLPPPLAFPVVIQHLRDNSTVPRLLLLLLRVPVLQLPLCYLVSMVALPQTDHVPQMVHLSNLAIPLTRLFWVDGALFRPSLKARTR